jgi:hypothetical protein
MPGPSWVRVDLQRLRTQREQWLAQGEAAATDAQARHARAMEALCRLLSAALSDHAESGGPQLAMAAIWVDGLSRVGYDLRNGNRLTPERAKSFIYAVDALLSDYTISCTLPGPAIELIEPASRRRRRLGPFEDLARQIRHKGAIDALQRHVPEFQTDSVLVDAAMGRAVESARRTGADLMPDGQDRIARQALLNTAADAVEGLSRARPWLEAVEDPWLHPGAAILFERLDRRLRATRALAALDVLRVSSLQSAAMSALRETVEQAVQAGQTGRAVQVLAAHAPALECARALVDADDVGLNTLGASIAAQVGRALPRRETVALLDRLRRLAVVSDDPLAAELVRLAGIDGDVDEQALLSVEAMGLDTPVTLHEAPDPAAAAAVLARRRMRMPD